MEDNQYSIVSKLIEERNKLIEEKESLISILSRIVGSMSLERVERFDWNNEAKEILNNLQKIHNEHKRK